MLMENYKFIVLCIFQVFDKNKDGRVTKSEIRQTFHTMKVDLTDEQLNEMMAEADKNKDGKIDKAGRWF